MSNKLQTLVHIVQKHNTTQHNTITYLMSNENFGIKVIESTVDSSPPIPDPDPDPVPTGLYPVVLVLVLPFNPP